MTTPSGSHYEQAFEHCLRAWAIPYVAIDEARRALVSDEMAATGSLKHFDFVLHSQGGPNLLVDVKGRKLTTSRGSSAFQNWVPAEDVDHLGRWETLFGQGFIGTFVFLYWCDAPPPDALFQDVFEHAGRWYAMLAITLADYRQHMKPRSVKWETVNLPSADFTRCAQPLRPMLRPTHTPI